jgi:hypothetical protein
MAYLAQTDSGWVNTELKTIFLELQIEDSECALGQRPMVLNLDGHSSNTHNRDLIAWAKEHKILLITPTHCTAASIGGCTGLQQCDRSKLDGGPIATLKSELRVLVRKQFFASVRDGAAKVTLPEMISLFEMAYEHSLDPDKVAALNQAVGYYVDPESFLQFDMGPPPRGAAKRRRSGAERRRTGLVVGAENHIAAFAARDARAAAAVDKTRAKGVAFWDRHRGGVRNAESALETAGGTPSRLKVAQLTELIVSRTGKTLKAKSNANGAVLAEARAVLADVSNKETRIPATPPRAPHAGSAEGEEEEDEGEEGEGRFYACHDCEEGIALAEDEIERMPTAPRWRCSARPLVAAARLSVWRKISLTQ